MKKVFLILLSLVIGVLFVGTVVFLYQKSQEPPVRFTSTTPFVTDIINKTVATGQVIPRREINIKSQVSGVVDVLYVEPGQSVNKGDLLARIELIPDMERLSQAETQLETARINFRDAQRELTRQKKLFEDGLISEFTYERLKVDFELKQEAVAGAENAVALIREGATRGSGMVSNMVKATAEGMVLDVPAKEGSFVIETNTFNEGTTIAIIANMNDMIFEGKIDESEVGKLQEGMDLLVNIGALDSIEPLNATLEYIAPKGIDDQGTKKFEIRASVESREGVFLRAGYSANADIVLARRQEVLAVNEGDLIIEGPAIYVEVETGEQRYEKRRIETGLSDGINIEVLSGLKSSDRIKQL